MAEPAEPVAGIQAAAEISPLFDSVPVDPIAEIPPAVRPIADPFIASQPLSVASFTGARVYGDAATCNPCRNLLSDLQYLQEFRGWSLSYSADQPADWQYLPARGSEGPIPLIEFWRAGALIGTDCGYSNAESRAERLDVLRALCRQHPSNLPRDRR